MLFKLSNLNSNHTLTLAYLNPALNNSLLVPAVLIHLVHKWDLTLQTWLTVIRM